MAKLIKSNQPCDKCGSSDARAYYKGENGHDDNWYCFSCDASGFLSRPEGSLEFNKTNNRTMEDYMFIQDYPIAELKSRGISEDVSKHFGVRVEYSESTGEEEAYYFPFYKDGVLSSYKKRELPKRFSWTAEHNNVELFGQHLSSDKGNMVILCEGLEDTMAGYEMLQEQGKNYRIVGLPDGVNSARKHIEYLSNFDTIIIMFDSDEAGIKGARKVSELFKPGQAKVSRLPTDIKDVNDLLLSKDYDSRDFLRAVNNSKILTPVGIVDMSDTWDRLFSDDNITSVKYPWTGLNDKLYGLRKRELVTLTAGSGLGKSAVTRELEYHLLKNTEDNIGILALEEDVARTGWGLMSIDASFPLHIREEREGLTKEELREYFNNTIGTGRVFCLDHFGSTGSDTLLNKIRYLVNGLSCSWIFLDHLSIVVSGMDDAGDSERLVIDKLMTDLRSLVQETGCGMILVSHLRRTGGDKGHEKGDEVALSHLRGSQSIAQLSDSVIALERNQQAEDEVKANTTVVRVLKNRYAGLTGIATYLHYDKSTGRLSEVFDDPDEFKF